MKKILFLLLFSCIMMSLHAQKLRVGLQGGIGVATFITDTPTEYADIENVFLGIAKEYPVLSYTTNLYVSYKINENWGIAVEPGFIRKGSAKKIEVENKLYRNNTFMNYIQIPVLAEIYVGEDENLTLTMGPEIAILLRAEESSKVANLDITNDYKNRKIDPSLQVGLYYTFAKHFDIGLKAGVSFLKIGNVTLLNEAKEVVAQYKQYNTYGHAFLRIKL